MASVMRLLHALLIVLLTVASIPALEGTTPDSKEEEEKTCAEFSSKVTPRRLRHAMMNHEPFHVPMWTTMGRVATGRHWDIFDSEECVNVGITYEKVLFGPMSDVASPIGLRKVVPALLECVRWPALRALIEQQLEPKQELPTALIEASASNYNDIMEDGDIPLLMAVKHSNRGIFTDARGSETLMTALRRPLLANLTDRLTEAAKKGPVDADLFLSAGGFVEKLHYDDSNNFYCQVVGSKDFSFFSSADIDKLYPVIFADGDVDFQLLLRPDGRLIEERIPEEFRDQKALAAVDIDEPDNFRFPKFAKAARMTCHVQPGHCLWMPSFWWYSSQAQAGELNMAIGYRFGSKFPVNKTKFDVEVAEFAVDSQSRVTHRELRERAKHTEL